MLDGRLRAWHDPHRSFSIQEGRMNGRRLVSLGLNDEKVPEGQHIVFIYSDDGEKKRTMARFLQQGLLANEKVLYLVNDIAPDDMREELCALGVDATASQSAFDMMEAHYKQCPDDYFSPDYMLGLIGSYYREALQEGYAGARGTGEMSWAVEEGRTTMPDLLRYEARLNDILAEHPLTAVCQYDARRFSGQVIMDILSVHPMAIVRGQLVKNPYFVPPAKFLQELEAQAAVSSS